MNKYLKILIIFVFASQASAESAGNSKSEAHFIRAKSLLLSALKEFDEGTKGNQELSMNSAAWRAEIIDRANELERVISPRARMSTTGAKFEAHSELLSESKR